MHSLSGSAPNNQPVYSTSDTGSFTAITTTNTHEVSATSLIANAAGDIYVLAGGAGKVAVKSAATTIDANDNGNWRVIDLPSNYPYMQKIVFDGPAASKKLIITGWDGSIAYFDGTSWAIRFIYGPVDYANVRITDIAFNGTRFVAVSESSNIQNGGIKYSNNDNITNTTWTWVLNQDNGGFGDASKAYGVVYGGGKFVAVGKDGKIAYSESGDTGWIAAASGTTEHLLDIAYGNDTFVAVGEKGTILYSADGVNWHNATSALTPASGLDYNSIAYGEGVYDDNTPFKRFAIAGTQGYILWTDVE
jgi:hypothetical protein